MAERDQTVSARRALKHVGPAGVLDAANTDDEGTHAFTVIRGPEILFCLVCDGGVTYEAIFGTGSSDVVDAASADGDSWFVAGLVASKGQQLVRRVDGMPLAVTRGNQSWIAHVALHCTQCDLEIVTIGDDQGESVTGLTLWPLGAKRRGGNSIVSTQFR